MEFKYLISDVIPRVLDGSQWHFIKLSIIYHRLQK